MGLLRIALEGAIATLTLDRPDKRNAMSDALLAEIDAFFRDPPPHIVAVILRGAGGHFCAGLDLTEHRTRTAADTMQHSRHWHGVMDRIQFGGLAVVSVLQGAVIGGGLELATATHVRIAESDARFQLPEGRRGIFVGGGASVRVGRILGPDRLTEMMLTGRILDAAEGTRLGLAHYAVGAGEGMALARELAQRIADNAPLSNRLMIEAVARIADMSRQDGLYTESLSAALAQSGPDAAEGLAAFLEKRPPEFRK